MIWMTVDNRFWIFQLERSLCAFKKLELDNLTIFGEKMLDTNDYIVVLQILNPVGDL